MNTFHEQYLTDKEGNRMAVVLPITTWKQILEALEEMDEIREYDEARRDSSETIPFEQAVSEIRQGMSD